LVLGVGLELGVDDGKVGLEPFLGPLHVDDCPLGHGLRLFGHDVPVGERSRIGQARLPPAAWRPARMVIRSASLVGSTFTCSSSRSCVSRPSVRATTRP
jgi:hypothetical protein